MSTERGQQALPDFSHPRRSTRAAHQAVLPTVGESEQMWGMSDGEIQAAVVRTLDTEQQALGAPMIAALATLAPPWVRAALEALVESGDVHKVSDRHYLLSSRGQARAVRGQP